LAIQARPHGASQRVVAPRRVGPGLIRGVSPAQGQVSCSLGSSARSKHGAAAVPRNRQRFPKIGGGG
jgi:hypothetical protein